MSNGYQGNQPLSGDNTGLSELVRQLMIMPFSTIAYSMQIFVSLLQGMLRVTNEGMNAAAGGTTQTLVGTGMPASAGATITGAGNTQPSNRKEERKMSEQSWSSGDEAWSMSEACKDKDPCDRLRLVRYKVLFLKDKLEHAFPEEEELVAEDITKDGFISWKIAEFIQKLPRREIRQPRKWADRNNYPGNAGGTVAGRFPNSFVIDLPDGDKKYLRVYSDVLAWYDREKKNYQREKVDALEEIRNAIRELVPGGGGQTQYTTSAEEAEETEGTTSPEQASETETTTSGRRRRSSAEA
jgi:hypothetical protein